MSAMYLISLVVISILVLLLLIIVFRIQAFISLLLVSIGVALAGGIPVEEITDTIRDGMGGTLGHIAIIIGIGTMIGELLQTSGGASKIAQTIMSKMGEKKAPWALTIIGLIVAIPVFFEVALILFIPLVYDMAKKSGKSLLYYGIPLVAGIAVAHAFIPPTPGPVTVSILIGADLGWVILFGIIAGIPSAIVGGIIWGNYIGTKIMVRTPEAMLAKMPSGDTDSGRSTPAFGIAVMIIMIPLILILSNTVTGVLLHEEHTFRIWMSFIGHPFTALLIAVIPAFYLLGTRLGYSKEDVFQIATRSMQPVGMIILLTGAGGVYGEVLNRTGIGDVIVEVMATSNLPIILFAFLLATTIRVAQGSATVAMVTTASLLSPVISQGNYSDPLTGAIVIAIACGATVLSHVNDTGFWMVKEFLGLTEKQTLLSWTAMETIIGVTGLAVLLAISVFL